MNIVCKASLDQLSGSQEALTNSSHISASLFQTPRLPRRRRLVHQLCLLPRASVRVRRGGERRRQGHPGGRAQLGRGGWWWSRASERRPRACALDDRGRRHAPRSGLAALAASSGAFWAMLYRTWNQRHKTRSYFNFPSKKMRNRLHSSTSHYFPSPAKKVPRFLPNWADVSSSRQE